MHYDMTSMAAVLGWPYRTYQDRELGNRGIPDYAAKQVLEAQQREREVLAEIMQKINLDIDKRYPLGIPSEI